MAGAARRATYWGGEVLHLREAVERCWVYFMRGVRADLDGLPPTLVQVGEHELLLDDSLRWADRAWGAGVEVEVQRFPDMWHDFQLQAGIFEDAAQAVGDIGAFLLRRWAD